MEYSREGRFNEWNHAEKMKRFDHDIRLQESIISEQSQNATVREMNHDLHMRNLIKLFKEQYPITSDNALTLLFIIQVLVLLMMTSKIRGVHY